MVAPCWPQLIHCGGEGVRRAVVEVVVVCFGSPLTADGNVRSQPEHLMRLLLSCRAAGLLQLLLQLLLLSLPVVLHMKHHYAQISKPTWQPTDI